MQGSEEDVKTMANVNALKTLLCVPGPSHRQNARAINRSVVEKCSGLKLGDNCIQNFHLGRNIVEYTVGNLVLR